LNGKRKTDKNGRRVLLYSEAKAYAGKNEDALFIRMVKWNEKKEEVRLFKSAITKKTIS